MSNEPIRDYFATALNSHGFVLVDPVIAHDSGFWHSRGNCNNDFSNTDDLIRRFGQKCDKCTVRTGDRRVILLYRSLSRLAERIEEVYGVYIADDQNFVPDVQEVKVLNAPIDREAEKLEIAAKQEEREERHLARLAEGHERNKKHIEWLKQRKVDAHQSRQDYYAGR